MTHAIESLGRGLFGGLELLQVFVGILVERFDATLAAEADQLPFVETVDGLSHAAEFVSGDQASGEGIRFGLFRCLGFFLRGFSDLGFGGLRHIRGLQRQGKGGCKGQENGKDGFHTPSLVQFRQHASHSPKRERCGVP